MQDLLPPCKPPRIRHLGVPAGPAVRMPELRIAVIYVLLASLWIIGSDTVLSLFVTGRPTRCFSRVSRG